MASVYQILEQLMSSRPDERVSREQEDDVAAKPLDEENTMIYETLVGKT